MDTNIISVTEDNKLVLNKPVDSDIIYYSEINEWFTNNAFRSFSLKLILKKTIYFKVDDVEYKVDENKFLLAGKQPYVKAYGDSKDLIKSICIDICPSTIAEAFTILSATNEYDFDGYFHHHFEFPEFYNSVYSLTDTKLGRKINNLIPYISDNSVPEKKIGREVFLDLAEQIILLEKGNLLALNGLPSVKVSTRRETLARLKRGKEYIDDVFLKNPGIAEIATNCMMSEFHFLRSFRQAFGITPYQYMLTKRLEHARGLLLQHKSIGKTALVCGFPDSKTFSKAFIRVFGYPPSKNSASFQRMELLC